MGRFFFIFLLVFFCACSRRDKTPADIIIRGDLSGIPDGWLYLVKADQWKTALDSVFVRKGRFELEIRTDSFFIPFKAALHYWNKNDSSRPVRLQFRNHLLDDSLDLLRDAFYVEKGLITISGTSGTKPWFRIRAGKETELFFKDHFSDIGWMGDADTALRKHKLLYLQTSIRENSSSYYLLQSVYGSKETYTKKELAALFDLFSKAIRNSSDGKQFGVYLSLRPDAGMPYPNPLLETPDGLFDQIIDSSSRLNMLVFWASWCAPCIKEIPQLKEIHRTFPREGLNMVGISIDEEREEWLQALSVQQMNWKQLLVPGNRMENILQTFSFSTIPLVVFTDSRGKELARFADYDPENTRRYLDFILKHSR